MSMPVQSASSGSWPQFLWRKCKEQPLVPLGAMATVGALLGATYNLRTGNRTRFNQFLRLRVYAQGATVVALMVYGGFAFGKTEEDRATQIREIGERRAAEREAERERKRLEILSAQPQYQSSSSSSSLPPTLSSAVDSDSSSASQPAAYPLRKEERMKVSDFARRLREAEAIQKEEDGQKKF